MSNQNRLFVSSAGAADVAAGSSVTVKVGLAAVALSSSTITTSLFATVPVAVAAVALFSSVMSSSAVVVTMGVPAGVRLPVSTTSLPCVSSLP